MSEHTNEHSEHLPSSAEAPLRRDIRMITSMLGETLTRTHGQDLLDLVESVRTAAKDDTIFQHPSI